MSKVKYDGWCIKYHWTDKLFPPVFQERSTVIKDYERNLKGIWRKNCRKGHVKMVKVRIVEVDE